MDITDVYISFKKCQAKFFNKFYRIPKHPLEKIDALKKDYQLYLKTVLEILEEKRLDPNIYFTSGFEIFGPKFSYQFFLNEKIMQVYEEKKKSHTKHNENVVKSFKKSYEYVKEYSKNRNVRLSFFLDYCHTIIDGIPVPTYQYNCGNICKYFITWLVYKGWLSHSDNPIDKQFDVIMNELKNTYTIPL
jgi:hypothetical protein